jgi:hypothetical protein
MEDLELEYHGGMQDKVAVAERCWSAWAPVGDSA